jgi:hypothetical protein
MLQCDGTTPNPDVTRVVGSGAILNPGGSDPMTMSGAHFCIRSTGADFVSPLGDPLLAASWTEVETLVDSHFKRYEALMRRLA